jgi:hypothetical protein
MIEPGTVAHTFNPTQEAEIRGIAVWSQPGQIVWQDPILKTPITKRTGGVAQGVGPEFKPQYCQKKKKYW